MSGSRPLIAVVDDEAPIRKALTRLLRSAGMDVASYSSGAEFLASCPTAKVDCVVLDLHMPDVDGFEVLRRLPRSPHRLPCIIITGHDQPETRMRVMAEHPVAYLRKPMNDDLLLDAITLALSSISPPPDDPIP